MSALLRFSIFVLARKTLHMNQVIFVTAPAPITVSFGWTYNLAVLFTPSLGSFFQGNLQTTTNSTLLNDIDCISCVATVTTAADALGSLTVSVTISNIR